MTKVYLGRPWRDFAKTVFIDCEIGSHILAEGWNNWGRPSTENTVFYAEYNTTGTGANQTKRVKWSKSLTKTEALTYSKSEIFAGKIIQELSKFWLDK